MVSIIAAYFINKEESSNDQTQIYAGNVDPYYTEIDFNTRGVVSDSEKLVKIAQFYDEMEFEKVVNVYNLLESSENLEGKYLHAIAVSHAKVEENEKAIRLWDMILDSEETKYTYHNAARFFKGRLLIDMGLNEEGRSLLNQVNKSSSYFNETQELLIK